MMLGSDRQTHLYVLFAFLWDLFGWCVMFGRQRVPSRPAGSAKVALGSIMAASSYSGECGLVLKLCRSGSIDKRCWDPALAHTLVPSLNRLLRNISSSILYYNINIYFCSIIRASASVVDIGIRWRCRGRAMSFRVWLNTSLIDAYTA